MSLGRYYVAVEPPWCADGSERIAGSYGGARSLYTTAGVARRYGGKKARILCVDLDALTITEVA